MGYIFLYLPYAKIERERKLKPKKTHAHVTSAIRAIAPLQTFSPWKSLFMYFERMRAENANTVLVLL